jgi:hypothetical protein
VRNWPRQVSPDRVSRAELSGGMTPPGVWCEAATAGGVLVLASGRCILTTGPAGLVVLTPPRFPQPAPSGCRWLGEGSAGGRSRRDAQRPSGDRGSRHADRVGSGLRECADGRAGMAVRSRFARQPVAAASSSETCRQSPSSPQDAQRGPSSGDAGQRKIAVQQGYPSMAAGHQSGGRSSRCTTTVEPCSALPGR